MRGWPSIVGVVALLALACGGGGNAPEPVADGGDVGTPPPAIPSEPARCGSTALWLSAFASSPIPYSIFEISVASVTATAAATPLVVAGAASGTHDLVADGEVPLGTIQLPADLGGLAEATLTLSTVRVVSGAGERVLAMRTAPIRFSASPEPVVADRCVAVVRLDLARSVQPDPEDGLLFLPQLARRHY